MADGGLIALAGLGITLGLRHGIDWDHIAAITDITGSAVSDAEAESARPAGARRPHAEGLNQAAATGYGSPTVAGVPAGGGTAVADPAPARRWRETRAGFFLATLYALGHAAMVVVLGLLAIWASQILPDWIDPIMERLVGATLLLLGVWIIYSLARYGRSFRLQSRWMLLFSLARRGWDRLSSAITRRPLKHSHEVTQYGPKTAFGIGLIHGVGAETGSQALLLASAAGATTRATGSLLLVFFTVGLLISNSLVAALSSVGFVSTSTKRTIYLVIGVLAAIFSLVVGAFFIAGRGADLPDLQQVLTLVFGAAPGGE